MEPIPGLVVGARVRLHQLLPGQRFQVGRHDGRQRRRHEVGDRGHGEVLADDRGRFNDRPLV